MIIEFTGVPCSGKSDVSHELVQLLREHGFSVCEDQYILSHNASSKKRAFKKMTACVGYTLKHLRRSVKYYRLLGSVRNWMNYVYLLSHHCRQDICVLEQGYLQLIGSFFDNREPQEETMKQLFEKLIPSMDIIPVFVSVSKETVLERANTRADKPFFVQTNTQSSAVDFSIATHKLLQDLWCRERGETLVVVSNEKDNAQREAAQQIFDTLKKKEFV